MTDCSCPGDTSHDVLAHFHLRLRPLHRALCAAVERLGAYVDRAADCVEPAAALADLASLAPTLDAGTLETNWAELTSDEAREELALRSRGPLPLDTIAADAALDAFEQETLLLCAAFELDRRFRTAIALLQEDASRRRPTIGLAASVTATSFDELHARHAALGRLGRLRRYGLVRALPAEHLLEEQLVLAPGVLDALLGRATVALRDPLERSGVPPLPASVDSARLAQIAVAMRAGTVAIVGVWGPRRADHEAVVLALATQLGIRARVPRDGDLAQAAADAKALGQLLWIDCEQQAPAALDALAHSPAWVCLTGPHPMRPSHLLAARPYVEIELAAPSYAERLAAWQALPLDDAKAADLAARYRFGRTELAAIARMASAAVALGEDRAAAIEAAAAKLVHPHSRSFARVIHPQRTADQLVLKPALHRQVMDVARMYRSWPYVREQWGFPYNGFKALFAGEPGTGKTLAAEVIAHELGLPLVAIDLSQVVSKWVGETEKNLDLVFREAEDSDAVLFFDEADALLGKRGEVQRGTDRYANLEVSFLLQRLEQHEGLVILATNLQGQMDKAFMRRFQVIAHFQRPEHAERLRLWRLALPAQAPLADDLDLAPFAKLDLTGAAIMTAAREAALHAAGTGASRITAADLVHGVHAQFRREARSVSPADLGPYGHHLPPTGIARP